RPRALLRSLYNTLTAPSPRHAARGRSSVAHEEVPCPRSPATPHLCPSRCSCSRRPPARPPIRRPRMPPPARWSCSPPRARRRRAALHALSLEGELRRSLPGDDGPTEMSGSVRVDVLPPDHYLRVDTLSPAPGLPGVPLATGLDGEETWSGPLPFAAAPNMIV